MRTRTDVAIAGLVIQLLLLASCATQKNVAAAPDGGRLTVRATEVTTDGDLAKIRGTVGNPFDAPVHAVRYVVTIYRRGSPQVLGVWQREVDMTIKPGESAVLDLDVQSEHVATGKARFVINAYPVKLGSQSIAPPPGWKN